MNPTFESDHVGFHTFSLPREGNPERVRGPISRAHRFEVENSSFDQNHHGFPGSMRSSSEVGPTFQTRLVMLRVHRTS